jgi:hypothetical protein
MVATSTGRDHVFECLTRFQVAFKATDKVAAHQHILEALHADPTVAWHEIIRNYSSAFNSIYSANGYFDASNLEASSVGNIRLHEIATYLDRVYRDYPEMVNVPPHITDSASIQACKEHRQRSIEQGSPYFLFVPQEKSGSTSFGNIIPNGFRLPCVTYSSGLVAVIPSWVKECAKGGGAYVTHLRPRPEAISNLRDGGLHKVVVHTRDPRQIYLSLLHHFELYRTDWPEKEKAGYYSLSFHQKAQSQLPVYDYIISWLDGWLKASKEGGLNILFTCFEDFVSRKDATVEKLLSFYSGDMKHFHAKAAHELRDDVDYHFRRGETEEWRRVFDVGLASQLTSKIPESWFAQFPWKP